MSDIWTFLGDPSNQATLSWLGGGLAVLAGGAWAMIRYFVRQPEPGQAAKPPGGTVRAGGRSSNRGRSGTQTVLLLLVVVGALVLVAGLAGDRIAAVGSSVVGGDVENSKIIIGPPPQEVEP